MVVATDRFMPITYGYIYDDGGLIAVEQTGTIGAQKVCTRANESRAYYSFRTGPIPNNATVDAVIFRLHLRDVIVPFGIDVQEYKFQIFYDHARIGDTITIDDWGGYAPCGVKSYGVTLPEMPVDIDVTLANASVNLTGDTDLEVQDSSTWAETDDGPTWSFHARWFPGAMMWMDVTYTMPSGLFNRWNWKLPALPGFSSAIAAVMLPSGDLRVIARFPAQLRSAEA